MYLKPIPQIVVIFLMIVCIVLGYFAGRASVESLECEASNDLNGDGEVTLQDFSIALWRVEQIQNELRNQHVPENVIEDVYPPVPLPYQPSN